MNKQVINKTANLLLAFTVGMVFLGGYIDTNPVFSTSNVLQNIYLLIFGAGGILIILILVIFTAKGKKNEHSKLTLLTTFLKYFHRAHKILNFKYY